MPELRNITEHYRWFLLIWWKLTLNTTLICFVLVLSWATSSTWKPQNTHRKLRSVGGIFQVSWSRLFSQVGCLGQADEDVEHGIKVVIIGIDGFVSLPLLVFGPSCFWCLRFWSRAGKDQSLVHKIGANHSLCQFHPIPVTKLSNHQAGAAVGRLQPWRTEPYSYLKQQCSHGGLS